MPRTMKTTELETLLPSDFQRIFGVSRRTALRWFQIGVRRELADLARFLTHQDLGIFAPEWRGWTLRRGELFDPLHTSTRGYTPEEIRALPYINAQVSAYRAAIARDKADGRLRDLELRALRTQPTERLRRVVRGVSPIAATDAAKPSNRPRALNLKAL